MQHRTRLWLEKCWNHNLCARAQLASQSSHRRRRLQPRSSCHFSSYANSRKLTFSKYKSSIKRRSCDKRSKTRFQACENRTACDRRQCHKKEAEIGTQSNHDWSHIGRRIQRTRPETWARIRWPRWRVKLLLAGTLHGRINDTSKARHKSVRRSAVATANQRKPFVDRFFGFDGTIQRHLSRQAGTSHNELQLFSALISKSVSLSVSSIRRIKMDGHHKSCIRMQTEERKFRRGLENQPDRQSRESQVHF